MKKNHLKKMAILGLTTGLIAMNNANAVEPTPTPTSTEKPGSASKTCSTKSGCTNKGVSQNTKGNITQATKDETKDPNSENEGYHLMTEEELKSQLNAKSTALYESLDAEGKALALKVASQRCNGTNDCKGLNACETPSNDCAGKGECKGKSKCAFADKNVAVKIVAKKMAEKRAQLGK